MATRSSTAVLLALLLVSGGSVLVVAKSTSTGNDSAVPEDGPAYGVNDSTFQRMWSDDTDDDALSLDDFDGAVTSREEFARRVAQSTDVPFDRPPAAAEAWNRGDLGDFEPGDASTSVHPAGASLADGPYIKDAYVSIVAVQPSTVFHEGSGTTQYVVSEGDVLAIADYRVGTPEGNESARDEWSILETGIESVELSADGRTLDTGRGHRVELSYADLSGSTTLTVEATITVRLRRSTGACSNAVSSSCDETVTVSKTVSASQPVVVNQLSDGIGTRIDFEGRPDEVGAVVHPGTAWSTIDVDGDVRARSPLRFYTAGRDGWRTIVTRTATATVKTPSSVRPVQVHAFPSERAPSVSTDSGERSLAVEATWGPTRPGPTLPDSIDLSPADPYERAASIAVRSSTLDESDFGEIVVRGIVRGQSRPVTLSEQRTVRETALDLTVVESNATHATVHAMVTEAATGDPVTTGNVTVENRTVPVNASGEALFTISNPSLVVRGEYAPVAWWRTDRPYAPTADVTKVPADLPEFGSIVQLVLVTILWFLPLGALVYGLDYASNGSLLGLTTHD